MIAWIDVQLLAESIPQLLHGASVTLQIAALSACIGIVLGVPLAFMQNSRSLILRAFVWSYVGLFRGTPMLVQVLFIYYVLPQVGVDIPPLFSCIAAMGLNSSAYISQIVQTGISAIPVGQVEAACTLGMSPFDIKRYIIFPQALRISLPALGNELITLIKDSSLASVIGVVELSKEGSIIRSRTYDAFSILLGVSVIYLIMTTLLSYVLSLYEARSKMPCYK